MPYEVSFTHPVEISDPEQYWNDCCIGGDVVLNRLLPSIRNAYDGLVTGQEDWGWFSWFEKEHVKLAVDIFTDDASAGKFRIHLTSRTPRFLLGEKINDTPQLDEVRALIVNRLSAWEVEYLEVVRVDDKYMPLDSAI